MLSYLQKSLNWKWESGFCFGDLHLCDERVVSLFDLNADWHPRKRLEHVFQQSKVPIWAAAVPTWRMGEMQTKATDTQPTDAVHLCPSSLNVLMIHLRRTSLEVSPYTLANPEGEKQLRFMGRTYTSSRAARVLPPSGWGRRRWRRGPSASGGSRRVTPPRGRLLSGDSRAPASRCLAPRRCRQKIQPLWLSWTVDLVWEQQRTSWAWYSLREGLHGAFYPLPTSWEQEESPSVKRERVKERERHVWLFINDCSMKIVVF